MDSKKKAAFAKKSAKGRKRMAKGGLIRQLGNRKYFDDGGTVLGGPTSSSVVPNETNPNTGLLGTFNGALGLNNNFQAAAANLQPGTNSAQLNAAYTGAQQGLTDQGTLVNELAPVVPQAVQNQNAVAAQERAIMSGSGPNPALEQLRQSTGENVANQAALMAGQRGASANAGLIAREAARQGAETQQQSAGQGATLSAEQQIAAANNLANISNNQVSQAGQAVTGENSARQNEQAILQNANTSMNNAAVGMQSNINNVNSQTSAANQNMAANTFGGLTSAISSASSLFAKGGEVGKDDHLMLAEMMAHGLRHCRKLDGIVKNYDEGGEVSPGQVDDAPNLGKFSAGDASASAPNVASTSSLPADQTDFGKEVHQPSSPGGGSGGGGGGIMSLAALFAAGGPVPPPPTLGSTPINGPGPNWASAYFNPGSASNGPSIGSTAPLPANNVDLSKSTGKGKKKDQAQPETTTGQAAPWEVGGGVAGGPGDTMDNSAPMSPENDMGEGTDMTLNAARGAYVGNHCPGPHKSHVANFLSGGGAVPAMVSEGEIYLNPEQVEKVVREGANPLKVGMKIKAKDVSQKARMKGDSLKNDKIPMDLEEGGVVIDREHVMSPEKAELFVHRALARKKARA